MKSTTLSNVSTLFGRAMLASIFITAGFSKITSYAATQSYMESSGVPGLLLPAVIALEVVGGLSILIGFQTQITAALLGGFTLLAAILFHSDFSQQLQAILLMKNIGIAGAFLLLFSQGPGQWAFNPQLQTQEI
ncbi:MAG: DoxX family protein [Gammaproteobacteria bacterium]|nr:DoxX family protein [Gammaproteobacteria bacterium]